MSCFDIHLQCRQFATTVANAIKLLSQALDDGSYRFTFFFKTQSEKSMECDYWRDANISDMEWSLAQRLQELGESEETASHDILTGRLMV
jgi:hypothetical protein